jgi:hypothetical protein
MEADPVPVCRVVQMQRAPLHQVFKGGRYSIPVLLFLVHESGGRESSGKFRIDVGSTQSLYPLFKGSETCGILRKGDLLQTRQDSPSDEINFESKNGTLV